MRTNLIVFFAMAALGVGCGGSTGDRRARLATTQGLPDAGGGMFQPPFVCMQGMPQTFDCINHFSLRPDGHITDFSNREWDNMTGTWCDESGFHGKIYGYTNSSQFPQDTHSQIVNTDDSSFHLALSVSSGQYGGGGLEFDGGCLDVSAFSGVQFTAAVVSGSLAACPLQLQIQTFDQRPITPAPGGSCDSSTGVSCYGFPAATSISVTSTDPMNPTLISLPWSSFSKITGTSALMEVVGLQWQVNASGACQVELALSKVGFIPAAAGADAATD